MVKPFNVKDTTFMKEIEDARKLAQDILEGKKMSACPEGSGEGLLLIEMLVTLTMTLMV